MVGLYGHSLAGWRSVLSDVFWKILCHFMIIFLLGFSVQNFAEGRRFLIRLEGGPVAHRSLLKKMKFHQHQLFFRRSSTNIVEFGAVWKCVSLERRLKTCLKYAFPGLDRRRYGRNLAMGGAQPRPRLTSRLFSSAAPPWRPGPDCRISERSSSND